VPFGALLDELAFGVAVISAGGRLIHANRTALLQLRACCGLRITGILVKPVSASDRPLWEGALAGAAHGKRCYVALGSGAGRLDVAILPMAPAGRPLEPRVALVFEKCASTRGLGLHFFAQNHGLTRTEQSVLTEISDGIRVSDVADRLGSSVHTTRTHLRNILRKTGESNLRCLMLRIGRLPPIGTQFASAGKAGDSMARDAGLFLGLASRVPRPAVRRNAMVCGAAVA
jgi:DNA-binding CsgD family transcriptional regulator